MWSGVICLGFAVLCVGDFRWFVMKCVCVCVFVVCFGVCAVNTIWPGALRSVANVCDVV